MKLTLQTWFSAALLLGTALLARADDVIRIKAGVSTPLTDETGIVWQADKGFSGGDTIERPDIAIANTKTPSLYRAERYSMSAFRWPLPNGKYTVKLHFAETFEEIYATGQRVFSFNVEGRDFKDFDVWQKAGGALRAHVETVEVEVTDGALDIGFTHRIENPQICALEIIPVR
jgi:endoglucanase